MMTEWHEYLKDPAAFNAKRRAGIDRILSQGRRRAIRFILSMCTTTVAALGIVCGYTYVMWRAGAIPQEALSVAFVACGLGGCLLGSWVIHSTIASSKEVRDALLNSGEWHCPNCEGDILRIPERDVSQIESRRWIHRCGSEVEWLTDERLVSRTDNPTLLIDYILANQIAK